MNNLLKNILSDINTEIADEFDRNFERKGFFGQPWAPRKFHNNKGSVLMQRGKLRSSIRAKVSGNAVSFTSSLPYAEIHNEGGEITITANMQKVFSGQNTIKPLTESPIQ
jgi:Phage virion morphogenesis family.